MAFLRLLAYNIFADLYYFIELFSKTIHKNVALTYKIMICFTFIGNPAQIINLKINGVIVYYKAMILQMIFYFILLLYFFHSVALYKPTVAQNVKISVQ